MIPEILLLLFAMAGIRQAWIHNNANEIIQGKFYQKLKDAACHFKQLEAYTPCSNATERKIEELKKGAGCKLLMSRAPKKLRNDCLESEDYFKSNTAHDIYKPDGMVPETVMSGKTSDISQFCKLN